MMTYYNAGENNEVVADMLRRWDNGDGKPMKGSLIDYSAYEENPGDLGCMCAQGQVLHLVGGMSPKEIKNLEQKEADERSMKELGISRAHAILLRNVNDSVDGAPSIVLTHPEKVLGDEAPAILAFWKYMDSLDSDGWQMVLDKRAAAGIAAGNAARAAAWNAARAAAGVAAWDAAGAAAGEIQGHKILKKDKKPLLFLSFFGFKSVKAILDWAAENGA